MAADSLVTEKAVVDLANAINANKAGKSELKAIANAADALKAQVDAMPNLVVVPAGKPAPTDLPDGVIVVMEDPTGGTAA